MKLAPSSYLNKLLMLGNWNSPGIFSCVSKLCDTAFLINKRYAVTTRQKQTIILIIKICLRNDAGFLFNCIKYSHIMNRHHLMVPVPSLLFLSEEDPFSL